MLLQSQTELNNQTSTKYLSDEPSAPLLFLKPPACSPPGAPSAPSAPSAPVQMAPLL